MHTLYAIEPAPDPLTVGTHFCTTLTSISPRHPHNTFFSDPILSTVCPQNHVLLCIIRSLFVIYSPNGVSRTSTRIQLVPIVTLYMSTCVYFAIYILFYADIYA